MQISSNFAYEISRIQRWLCSAQTIYIMSGHAARSPRPWL